MSKERPGKHSRTGGECGGQKGEREADEERDCDFWAEREREEEKERCPGGTASK